ncbi:hypothetical protein RND81_08G132600 [Saponaria officinalis]|uniref:Zinc knuckle CX2CX3GHX4C domain-containing protein n=1 Tax=Saponaria officinalis TaxID=3572 RepID=A0AAW1J8I1_SAPOF
MFLLFCTLSFCSSSTLYSSSVSVYADEAMLIPINTSVMISRVPGLPRMPIVIPPVKSTVETKLVDDQSAKGNFLSSGSSFEASDFDDDFGDDIYATNPEFTMRQSNIPPNKSDEDSKIKALVESSGFHGQSQAADGLVRGCGLRQKTPPPGYICRRCNIPGHYIQHCPTNGDPSFDIRKVKPTTAVLEPNEAAFEKEVEGISSVRSTVVDLPPELRCPLCNEVMTDAVFTSKCCYRSFCVKCIRDYIISKSMCFCEAKNILADDLVPNKTVRDTINRILESGNSSAGSSIHIQDLESAHCLPPKTPSPTQSAVSNVDQKLPPTVEDPQNVKECVDKNEATSVKETIIRIHDLSKATPESASVKDHISQNSVVPPVEAQQKLAASDAGKKKKRKRFSPSNESDVQGMAIQTGMNGYAGPSNFYHHSPGMQTQMDGYMGPFAANTPYYTGYHLDPVIEPWANVMLPELEPHYFTYPPMIPPQREIGIRLNGQPPYTRKEEFKARRTDSTRNGEIERQSENRELPRDDNFRKHCNNANVLSTPKPSQVRTSPSLERESKRSSNRDHNRGSHHHRSSRVSLKRFGNDIPHSSLKRKAEQHERDHDYVGKRHHQSASNATYSGSSIGLCAY